MVLNKSHQEYHQVTILLTLSIRILTSGTDDKMTGRPGTIRSKRLNLRFNGGQQSVTYKTEFDDGEAFITNISAGGAALQTATVPLSVNDRILLCIHLYEPEETIEIQATVVRSHEDTFSVQFQGTEEALKGRIIRFFNSLAQSR